MNILRRLGSMVLLLALVPPAFCGAQSSLVGLWHDPRPLPTGIHGSTAVLDFRPDGTEHVLYRHEGKLLPVRLKDGRPDVVHYSVKDGKIVWTTLDGKHLEEQGFSLKADTLTFLPSAKYPAASTMVRIKS